MSRFNNNSRGGGFSRGGDRGGFRNDRGGGSREMFDTVCSSCGKACKVPFNPTSGKPVYCSDCFEKVSPKSGGSDRRDSRFGRSENRERSPRADYSTQLNNLGEKLDKIIELLSSQPKPAVKKVSKVKKASKSE